MTRTVTATPPEISEATVIPKRKRTRERAQFLSDVITTAVEGGINYWASVSDYRWWDPTLDGGTALHDGDLPNAYVVVHDDSENDEVGKLITVDDIARALGIIQKRPIKYLNEGDRADILNNDRTNGDPTEGHQDIDANLADSIMQVAVLGEIIYG